MGDFVILKDSDIYKLLIDLSREDILAFQKAIRDCLIQFSTGEERMYQPAPGVVNRPNGQKTLFRAFTSAQDVGTKIIVDPAPSASGEKQPLHGILVVCDKNGIPSGIMNAEELTGYRTSLSALIPFAWRKQVAKIVVFGAGKQALWHVRLALGLRGTEVKKLSIANRSMEKATQLLETIKIENEERWHANVTFEVINLQRPESLRQALRDADVVFCTVPSTEPLFAADDLLQREKQNQPLVTAIGSWQPQMIELDPDLLKHIVEQTNRRQCANRVIVDDLESCFTHTGEVIRSGLEKEDLLEIGEIMADGSLWRSLEEWLATGLIVYKSVGVGVTDLVAGSRILMSAKERGLGTTIKGI